MFVFYTDDNKLSFRRRPDCRSDISAMKTWTVKKFAAECEGCCLSSDINKSFSNFEWRAFKERWRKWNEAFSNVNDDDGGIDYFQWCGGIVLTQIASSARVRRLIHTNQPQRQPSCGPYWIAIQHLTRLINKRAKSNRKTLSKTSSWFIQRTKSLPLGSQRTYSIDVVYYGRLSAENSLERQEQKPEEAIININVEIWKKN